MQYPSKREIRLMLCMTVCFDRQAHRPQPPDGTDPQGAVRAAQPCERVSAVRPRTVFLEHFLVSPSCDVRCGNASVVFLCFSGDAGISPATTSAAPSRQPARSRTSPSAGSRHRARLSLFPHRLPLSMEVHDAQRRAGTAPCRPQALGSAAC